MWPSLRAFCADCALFFFCAVVEWVVFLDVWPEEPAWNDTRSKKRETNTDRLTSTALIIAENRRP